MWDKFGQGWDMSSSGGIKDKIADAIDKLTSRPNILLITCDQYRFPRFSYGADGGFHQGLKEVLGFQPLSADNEYAEHFPGLMRLRKNSVVLRNHTIAASACTPSRAVIYTGQYGTRTGVTQTDGLFKNGDAPNFPWLDADGIPTLGTWMRHAGYTTHYFGKWHVSNPPEHSLKRWGFDDWEASYPEPHGSQANNLGVYRDVGFTDSACAFIRRMGLANDYNRVYANMLSNDPNSTGPKIDHVPWFAVASFTNPHDIATYPGVVSQALGAKPTGPLYVPPPRTLSADGDEQLTVTPPPVGGKMQIPLNPLDFPQDCANLPPTLNEDLSSKPSCQQEYAYKMGLALASKLGFTVQTQTGSGTDAAVAVTLRSTIPFQLADQTVDTTNNPPAEGLNAADGNSLVFLQLYGWLHAVVDKHVNDVLTALEESGQAENTIVIFLADHGEYGAAHGMMIEKWHTAYAEALHVPMVIVHPKGQNTTDEPIQSDALTSHVDIVPTVLGFAGVTNEIREKIAQEMMRSRPVPPLPGVDLAPLILGEWPGDRVVEQDGNDRQGVLFITDDEITAPLAPEASAFSQRAYAEFDVYCAAVDRVIAGKPGHEPVPMQRGPVKQPNHVRCVRSANFKLARYFDPSHRVGQEWEMYDLRGDAIEKTNLVQTTVTPPTMLPQYASLQSEADSLYDLLKELEERYLS
jgi:arylsulfatase A-like enzyme